MQKAQPSVFSVLHDFRVVRHMVIAAHAAEAEVCHAAQDDSNVGHVAHLAGAATGAAMFFARRRGFIGRGW